MFDNVLLRQTVISILQSFTFITKLSILFVILPVRLLLWVKFEIEASYIAVLQFFLVQFTVVDRHVGCWRTKCRYFCLVMSS